MRPSKSGNLTKHEIKLPQGVEEIRIDIGPKNSIYWYEEVLAINDTTFVLDVKLTGADQVDWFLEQLKRGVVDEWFDENSYSDRKAINERYGFS